MTVATGGALALPAGLALAGAGADGAIESASEALSRSESFGAR